MTVPHPLDPSSLAALDYLPPIPTRTDVPIGVIGCGGIAGTHLRAYRAAVFRVVALCDVRADAGRWSPAFAYLLAAQQPGCWGASSLRTSSRTGRTTGRCSVAASRPCPT